MRWLRMLATVMTVAWPAAAADHGDAHPDDGVSAGVETLLLEAEEFVPAPGLVAAATTCWTRQNRSQNYFSSAFGAPGSGMGSTFLSRKAFLGAPASIAAGAACVATMQTSVKGGMYVPLVRFEAPCQPPACFETQFQLEISQAGKTVFSAVYGSREQLDNFGAVSLRGAVGKQPGNMLIWQGQTERVPLRPGVVTVSLVTSAELSPPNSAKRNVDAVLLSSNTSGLAIFANHDGDTRGNLPFDGLLTQHADLFLRVVNKPTGVPPDPESTHQHDEY